jgi:transforming growth factor-beta-induced protein
MDLAGKAMLFLLAAIIIAGQGMAAEDDSEKSLKDAAAELGLETFPALLEEAGLADTVENVGILLIGNGSFAVFAPQDDAFSNMSTELEALEENRTDLRRVLSYHLVCGEGLDNLSQLSSLETLEGENLTIDHDDGLRVNGAKVVESKSYDNGTIYVIDKLLLPEKTSGAGLGVIEAARDLGAEKFAAALQDAGLADTLNGQGLLGFETLSQGPFTVFAPSDEAFNNVPKTVMDSIETKEQGMTILLSYHLVEASALNTTEAGSVKTVGGESLPVDMRNGLVGGARVLDSKRYDNGIIYMIDQVLIPVKLSM